MNIIKSLKELAAVIRAKEKPLIETLKSTPEHLDTIELKIKKAEKRIALAITTATVITIL